MRRACRPMCWSPISPSISALGRERRDGVDDDEVDGAGADEGLGDVERLLAGVGLRHEQIAGVDADAAGVLRVERVLRVDEGATPPPRCASAIACRASVVLPLDSGPYISTTRPRG